MIGHVALLAAAHVAYPDAGDAVITDRGGDPYEVRADVGGVPRAVGLGATCEEARAHLAAILWDTAARGACARVGRGYRYMATDDSRGLWELLAAPRGGLANLGRVVRSTLRDVGEDRVADVLRNLYDMLSAVCEARYDAAERALDRVTRACEAVAQ